MVPVLTLKKYVGRGNTIFFWTDVWVGHQPFDERFDRLFMLDTYPHCLVSDRFQGGNWRWEWRREIRGGCENEKLQGLLAVLNGIEVSSNHDSYSWMLDPLGYFTVNSTRNHIHDVSLNDGNIITQWCKIVPKKVNIFIWRLILDRLPTLFSFSKKPTR